MAKTVSISEETIIAMLRQLPESTLMDIFSKTLVRNVTHPLSQTEEASCNRALAEYERGEVVDWRDLK